MEIRDKISSWQLGLLVFLAAIEVGILALPSTLAQTVGNDAWMVPLFTGAIIIVVVYVMGKIIVKYPSYSYTDTLRLVFGNIIGTFLAIPVFLHFNMIVGLELRFFAETTKLFLIERTPLEFIILPILLLTVLLVRSGIEPVSRFFEVVFPLVLLSIVALMLVVLPKSDFTNLKPFFSAPALHHVTAISTTFYPYLAYEFMLVLAPNLRNPNKAFATVAYAIVLLSVVYSIFTVQVIARLGVEVTKFNIFPLMAVVRSSAVPGGFIERFEGIIMALWVIFAYTTLVGYAYIVSLAGKHLFNQKKTGHIFLITMPFSYLFALQGESFLSFSRMLGVLAITSGAYTAGALPIVLYFAIIIKEKAGRKA